jgi:hypothetical protein
MDEKCGLLKVKKSRSLAETIQDAHLGISETISNVAAVYLRIRS